MADSLRAAPPSGPTEDPFFYTWTAQQDAVPLAHAGGAGARFFSVDGEDWIDLGSMTWNANLGHGHQGMQQALATAAARGLLAQPASVFDDKRRAAHALLSVAPADLAENGGKVFFCLSGAEANENAVKMAMLVTGRRKIVHRARSYHGATLGMLALSGDPRRRPFELGWGLGISWDDPYSTDPCPGDLETLILEHGAAQIAAVLLEGVVGPNGVRVPPPGYYQRIRALCDRHGILFICDEVLSGFGRTGRWFAVDHDGVAPDLLTCGKGLTGGYTPGGAVVVSGRVARFFDDHVLSCGLTSYAHPLVCAAIAAAIDNYRAERLVERAAAMGHLLGAHLERLAHARGDLLNVRGIGLLWAVDLLTGDGALAGSEHMRRVAAALRAQRVHVHRRDHTLFFAPPLVVTESELEEGIDRVVAALDAAKVNP